MALARHVIQIVNATRAARAKVTPGEGRERISADYTPSQGVTRSSLHTEVYVGEINVHSRLFRHFGPGSPC